MQETPPAKRLYLPKLTWKRVMLLFLVAVLGGVYWFIPPVWRLKGESVEVTRWERKRGEVHVRVGPQERGWIQGKRISRHVYNAMIVAEDARFYQHNGLDMIELAKSYETNMRHGRYVRGGSTITQQVVKMAFLTREKTLIRKAREAVGALLVEKLLTKAEILEWYINLAEFGDAIYGLREASDRYFNTKPELLTIQQAVHLALVLPSPNSWSRGLRQRNLTPFGHQRYATIASRMRLNGYITAAQWQNVVITGNFGGPIAGAEKIAALSDQDAAERLRQWLAQSSPEEDDTGAEPTTSPNPSMNLDASEPTMSIADNSSSLLFNLAAPTEHSPANASAEPLVADGVESAVPSPTPVVSPLTHPEEGPVDAW